MRLPAALTPLVSERTVSEQELLEPESGGWGEVRGATTSGDTAGENADDHQDTSDVGSHGLPDRNLRSKKIVPSVSAAVAEGGVREETGGECGEREEVYLSCHPRPPSVRENNGGAWGFP